MFHIVNDENNRGWGAQVTTTPTPKPDFGWKLYEVAGQFLLPVTEDLMGTNIQKFTGRTAIYLIRRKNGQVQVLGVEVPPEDVKKFADSTTPPQEEKTPDRSYLNGVGQDADGLWVARIHLVTSAETEAQAKAQLRAVTARYLNEVDPPVVGERQEEPPYVPEEFPPECGMEQFDTPADALRAARMLNLVTQALSTTPATAPKELTAGVISALLARVPTRAVVYGPDPSHWRLTPRAEELLAQRINEWMRETL